MREYIDLAKELEVFGVSITDTTAVSDCNIDIVTPEEAASKLAGIIKEETLINPDSKYICMYVKSGSIMGALYNILMQKLASAIPDSGVRAWHIINNQLYGIAANEYYKLCASKLLLGAGVIYKNIVVVENYIKLMQGKVVDDTRRAVNGVEVIRDLLKRGFGQDMKFDVVIGNPPYQDNTATIYQHFINRAIELSERHVVMVVKNNWLSSDTLKDTRDNMIKNGLYKVVNYPIPSELFPAAGVSVNIFALDKTYTEEKIEVVSIKNGEEVERYRARRNNKIIAGNRIETLIMDRAQKIVDEIGSFDRGVLPVEPFRITSSFMVGRGRSTYEIDHSVLETEEFNIKLAYMDNGDLQYAYIRREDVPNRAELVDTYKLICGGRMNNNGKVVTNLRVIDKGTVCTSSWGVIYCNKRKEVLMNALSLAKTKTFRFLVKMMVDSNMIGVSPYRFSLVPMVELSEVWNDEKLYKLLGFDSEMIAHIEKTMQEG